MESKIFIDANCDGQPQIRIDYRYQNQDGDLRDKMLGRFLLTLTDVDPRPERVPLYLEYGHVSAEGIVAFITVPAAIEADSEIQALQAMIKEAYLNIMKGNITFAKEILAQSLGLDAK